MARPRKNPILPTTLPAPTTPRRGRKPRAPRSGTPLTTMPLQRTAAVQTMSASLADHFVRGVSLGTINPQNRASVAHYLEGVLIGR